MKKIIAVIMIAILAMGTTAALAEIDADAAKQIALEKAEVNAMNATFTECHRDFEHGRQVWEVEFRSGGMEYEFDIDAGNGQVLDMDVDYFD